MSRRSTSLIVEYQQIILHSKEIKFPTIFPRSDAFYTWVQKQDLATSDSVIFQRIFDEKTKMEFLVLNVKKDEKAIDETEGILPRLIPKIAGQNIDPVNLIKKVWKTAG